MMDKIQTLETRLRNDPMVSTEVMDHLKTRRAKGLLSDAQYYDELEKLNDAPLDISLGAGSTSFLNDWKEISVALEEMEHTLEKRANIQFKLGTSGVPIGIALVLGALAISVYFKVPFIAAAGLAHGDIDRGAAKADIARAIDRNLERLGAAALDSDIAGAANAGAEGPVHGARLDFARAGDPDLKPGNIAELDIAGAIDANVCMAGDISHAHITGTVDPDIHHSGNIAKNDITRAIDTDIGIATDIACGQVTGPIDVDINVMGNGSGLEIATAAHLQIKGTEITSRALEG